MIPACVSVMSSFATKESQYAVQSGRMFRNERLPPVSAAGKPGMTRDKAPTWKICTSIAIQIESEQLRKRAVP